VSPSATAVPSTADARGGSGAGSAGVDAVVVLAAGQGTRMRSPLPKVLHEIGGRSMLGHVLAAVAPLEASAVLVVDGDGRSAVEEHLGQVAPAARPVVQEEQNGSGHAASVALAAAPDLAGTVLIVNGDAPLLRPGTVAALVEAHRASGAVLTVLTAEVGDPTGLGRIVRDEDGAVRAIVEEKDADPAQRALREVNAGVYVGDVPPLGNVFLSRQEPPGGGWPAVHLGHHHGLDGTLLALGSLTLARALPDVRIPRRRKEDRARRWT